MGIGWVLDGHTPTSKTRRTAQFASSQTVTSLRLVYHDYELYDVSMRYVLNTLGMLGSLDRLGRAHGYFLGMRSTHTDGSHMSPPPKKKLLAVGACFDPVYGYAWYPIPDTGYHFSVRHIPRTRGVGAFLTGCGHHGGWGGPIFLGRSAHPQNSQTPGTPQPAKLSRLMQTGPLIWAPTPLARTSFF